MPKTSAFDSKKSWEIHKCRDWGGYFCSRTAWKAPCWLQNDVQPSKCNKTKLWFIHPSNFKQSQIWGKVSYAKVPCWSLGKGRFHRHSSRISAKIFKVTLMLVTDVCDEMYWWQLWDIDDQCESLVFDLKSLNFSRHSAFHNIFSKKLLGFIKRYFESRQKFEILEYLIPIKLKRLLALFG